MREKRSMKRTMMIIEVMEGCEKKIEQEREREDKGGRKRKGGGSGDAGARHQQQQAL